MTHNPKPIPPLLNREDWAEIYYALQSKLASPEVVQDNEWTAHLENICESIGADGQDAAEFHHIPEQAQLVHRNPASATSLYLCRFCGWVGHESCECCPKCSGGIERFTPASYVSPSIGLDSRLANIESSLASIKNSLAELSDEGIYGLNCRPL
jgi:hypothetical protein